MRLLRLCGLALWSSRILVRAGAPSAGDCGPTSIANVPGCWGTPGCAYVIASDLGPGAACPYDYCNCGGTPVPLLPQVNSGTTTIGCASYTTQPSSSLCPTASPVIPAAGGPGSGSDVPSTTTTDSPGTTTTDAGPASTTSSALTSSDSSSSQGTTTTDVGPVSTTSSTSSDSDSSSSQGTTTTDAGPASTTSSTSSDSGSGSSQGTITTDAGPASTTSNTLSDSGSSSSQGTTSTDAGSASTTSSSSSDTGPSSSQSLPSGASVETGTVGTAVYTEVFVPTIDPKFSSLTGTITTTTFDAQNNPVTLVIGPGGAEWTPINLPSGQPEINPPVEPPVNSNIPSITGQSQTQTTGSTTGSGSASPGQTTSTAVPSTTSTDTASQSSVTDAFANTAQSETTIVVGGVTQHWSKATFADLTTVTAPTTITTPMVETNKDGSTFTISAAIIIVGPGGVWWNGGTGGFGLHGPSCLWPFCPPGGGGGGDVGGGGSGNDPKDPNTPGSTEEPTDPTDPDEQNQSQDPSQSQQSTAKQTSSDQSTSTTGTTTSSASSSSSSSSASCTLGTIVSDCAVSCASATGASTLSCATTCSAPITACSATGTTQYTTASGDSCAKPSGWANVADGDDIPDYEPLGPATPFSGGTDLSSTGSASGSGSNTADSTATSTTGPTSTGTAGPGSSATGATATLTTSSPGTGSAPSSNAATTSSVAPPECMADGAPWYSPTSWCDCGPSAKYPTLPPVSGQTSANCAYTTLPDSTLDPISVSAAPTNIPGMNGVPGCAGVVAVPGTSAYCNCGGTPAPTLSTTDSYINCQYTIQPTSSYNPAIPPPSSSAPPPAQTQKCNVHVWQGLGALYTDPQVVLDANITDASGHTVGHAQGTLNWGKSLNVDSQLPYVLVLTPQTGLKRRDQRSLDRRVGAPPPAARPLFEKGPLQFAYAGQSWDTSSSQCSVGAYDNGNANDFFGTLIFGDDFIPNRQMDCKFDCVVPNSKRSVDVQVSHNKRSIDVQKRKPIDRFGDSSREIAVRDWTTTDRTPSRVDHDLLEYRDLSKRASSTWVKYAASGAKYYKNWQDKTGDDVVYQCNFESEFNILQDAVKKVSPARKIQPVLSSLGYSTGKEYYAISLTGPKDGAPIADFTNTISASQGVFLANANNRGALPSDPTSPNFDPAFPQGRDPVPWQFSTVAWAMWTRTVLADNPQWAENPSQADYSGLKAFFRREIDNADTKAILEEAFAGKELTETLTWTPEDPDQNTNAFWPLLGSPNGNGMIYVLTDNKVALRGKGITSIQATTVDSDGVKYFTMWANYG